MNFLSLVGVGVGVQGVGNAILALISVMRLPSSSIRSCRCLGLPFGSFI